MISNKGFTAVGSLVAGLVLSASVYASDIPRTSEGRPDFRGICQAHSGPEFDLQPHGYRKDAPPGPGVVEGGFIPDQDWALEERNRRFASRLNEDARLQCFTLGTPGAVDVREPSQ